MTATSSIRRRLLTYLGIGLILLFIVTGIVSGVSVLHNLNETGDTQMTQLARQLSTLPAAELQRNSAPKINVPKSRRGFADDDDMGYAIWQHGTLVYANKPGRAITYQRDHQGFDNIGAWWDDNILRVYYLHNQTTQQTVAVSIYWYDRLEVMRDILSVQFGLSLLALPILFLLIAWAVSRSLRPLSTLTTELHQRNTNSLQQVSSAAPKEMQPMIAALNSLFIRVDAGIKREQRFTADAAHELRSPLAALKIQTEVLALDSNNDEQHQRIQTLLSGIDRTSHLLDQLLTLSKIDPIVAPAYTTPVNWETLTDQVLQQASLNARSKQIRLRRECAIDWQQILPVNGDEILLGILLRNLIDNAIRYSPTGSEVTMTLTANAIDVCDTGSGIASADLPRIKERFYRPAGQKQSGSGLGLAICDSIAALHGLQLALVNLHDEHGHVCGLRARLQL
jgi:two-component system sensor histidine kinase QseC